MRTHRNILILIFSLSVFQSSFANERLIIPPNQSNDFNCEIMFTPEQVKVYMFDQNSIDLEPTDDEANIRLPIQNSWGVYFDQPYTVHGSDYLGIYFNAAFVNQQNHQVSERGFLTNEDLGLFALGYMGSNSFYPLSSESMFSINAVGRDVVLTIKRGENSMFLYDDPPDEGHVWIINNESVRKCFAKTKIVSG